MDTVMSSLESAWTKEWTRQDSGGQQLRSVRVAEPGGEPAASQEAGACGPASGRGSESPEEGGRETEDAAQVGVAMADD